MWVAAHPDDESFAGAILAKASLRCGNPVHFVILTRGEGGEDCRGGEPATDLGAVRAEELGRVVDLYRATLRLEGLFNAPLPFKSFPKRDELARIWSKDVDPARIIAEEIRSFRPDILLTFAPVHGTTGHPEHELASRFAMAGVRMAADAGSDLSGGPHRVPNVYFVINRYPAFRVLGRLVGLKPDPFEATEIFDARQPCIDGKRCNEVMADNTLPHATQNKDMRAMRFVARRIHRIYLRRSDPFTELWDPFEPA